MTTTPATSDPTAPALSTAVQAGSGGVSLIGIVLSVAGYVNNQHVSVSAVVLAIAGLAGVLIHRIDVGHRFLGWLSTEHGRVSAVEPKLAALAEQVDAIGKVVDPNLAAKVETLAKTADVRFTKLETSAGVTPDVVRQAVRDVLAGAAGGTNTAGGVTMSTPAGASGGGLTVAPTVPPVAS